MSGIFSDTSAAKLPIRHPFTVAEFGETRRHAFEMNPKAFDRVKLSSESTCLLECLA
jgi:hypothetical protein